MVSETQQCWGLSRAGLGELAGWRTQSSAAFCRQGERRMQLSGPDSAPGVCQCRDEQGSSCFLDVYDLAKHVLQSAGGGQRTCGKLWLV